MEPVKTMNDLHSQILDFHNSVKRDIFADLDEATCDGFVEVEKINELRIKYKVDKSE